LSTRFTSTSSTESVDGEAFQRLVGVLHRQYPDAFGGVRMLDALGVDSGYRARRLRLDEGASKNSSGHWPRECFSAQRS
jgi:hypothetical protein